MRFAHMIHVGAAASAATLTLAVLATAGAAHAQATGRSVYSEKPLSVQDLERLWGKDSSKGAAGAHGRTRSVGIELGGGSPATGNDGAPAETAAPPAQAAPPSVSLPIQFDLNSDAVAPQFYEHIQNIAEYLKGNKDGRILVIGHTDSTGGADFNMILSMRRADAVKRLLVKDGVEAGRIIASGQGMQEPMAGEPVTSPKQRRVEFMRVAAQ